MEVRIGVTWLVTLEGDKFDHVSLLTYSMEQSPFSEANTFSANQEIPRILWNPKVHYRSQKCPPHVHILRQLDPAHVPTIHFLKIHVKIILPSTPGSTKSTMGARNFNLRRRQVTVRGKFRLNQSLIYRCPSPYTNPNLFIYHSSTQ